MRAMILLAAISSILLFATGCEKDVPEGVNHTPLTAPR
jgi:hypothetical protein